jgi:uncharacterized protein
MFEVATHLVVILALAAFLAGMVDAIAGGGALITVPMLLLAGASPLETLATNKVQGSFGAGTAVIAYARAGHVKPMQQLGMASVAALAGALGALVARAVPTDVLRMVMPVVLVGIALFFAFKPGLTDASRVERLKPAVFAFTAVPFVGAYDGFFGPGTGSFYMLAFVMLAGFGILKATAHTKMLNLASNLGGLAVFAVAGGVWWRVGLVMAVAQICGAALGAKLAMRIGARLIKPLLVVTSSALALRLLWQAWG